MDFNYAEFSAAFPWFFPAGSFAFGALVGSFLNVCIYRIPAGKSVVFPGSHCACGKPIAWYDNVPIFSWFILRGRARCCGQLYSFRYPFVEILTGGLFLACWLLLPPVKALCGMVFISCLICATFIDLDRMEIPDIFSIGLGILGVILSCAVPALHDQKHELFMIASLRSGVISLQGLLVGSSLVLWIALIADFILKKESMGFGDVKFVGAIGAFCGWQGTITAIFGGAVVGTLWFIAAKIWEKCSGKKMSMKVPEEGQAPTELGMGAHVPYGPMLAIGGALHFLFLHTYVANYFAEMQSLL